MRIKAGYSWDGATGFLDFKTIMRGSLVHDALYQLMREKALDEEKDRDAADKILEQICIDSGMWKWLARRVNKAVHKCGKKAASAKPKIAP